MDPEASKDSGTDLLEEEPEGFAKVATLVAIHESSAVFRRFKKLNYQRLLYRQAEILLSEKRLLQAVKRDRTHPERDMFHESWIALAYKKCSEPGAREQIKLVEQLQERLDEYSKKPIRWLLTLSKILKRYGAPGNMLHFSLTIQTRPSSNSPRSRNSADPTRGTSNSRGSGC